VAEQLSRAARLGGVILIAAALTACAARPIGDLGRPRPSYHHDVAQPAHGENMARARGEPVSDFNRTDQENEMHDRVWRFLVAPHAQDWQFDGAVQLQRTRITPPTDHRYSADRYYGWLKETHYQSSRTRYATVGADIVADLETLPETFAIICAVIEIDRQRALAYAALGTGLPAGTGEDVAARKYENDAFIAWFVRALDYRYASYDFALDSLLVETPHEQSMAVDESLRRLGQQAERARRHDFCGAAAEHPGDSSHVVIPSRYLISAQPELALPPK
jgi:hypothetical protein